MNFFTVSANWQSGNFLISRYKSPTNNSTLRKLMRIGILTLIILATAIQLLLAVPVNSQTIETTEISLELRNKSLQQAFQIIEKRSSFHFMYRYEDIKDINRIEIPASKKSVAAFLKQILQNTPLGFRQVDDRILITNREIDDSHAEPDQQSEMKAAARDVIIKGQVTDLKGLTLPGVSVKLKGTATGTTTDMDGRYSLTLPDANGILVFTYIGFTSQEVSVGGRSTVDVKLSEASTALNEVVVTALGIKREAKALGYAVAVVDHDAITENRTTSTMGTLQGKVAGVNITSPSTGPQGSTRIRIRGNSSFSGANTPLIVINGVPVDNSQFGGSGLNNSDGGDGLSSINPDDIESMTVLKGAAAAALYGSRAKDGVVMITTKSGNDTKGFGVDYNVNFTTDTPLDFTDFQYEYGQGERGIRPTTANPTSGAWSFGERFQPGMTQVLFNNITVPYVPVKDRVKQFFDTGINLTNTVSIANSGDKGGFNVSFSNTDNNSIVPNSDFNRKTINLGFSQKISKRLSTQGNINYSNEYNKNPAQVGGQEFSIPSAVFTVSNSMPWNLLRDNRMDAQGNEIVWNRFLPRTNPYFSAYEKFENVRRDRVFGNIALKLELTDWLYVQGRIAQDYYDRDQDFNYPTGYAAIGPAPSGYVNGSYFMTDRKFRERNYDFLIGGQKTFNQIGIDFTLGGNQMYRRSDVQSQSTQDFIQKGLYTIMNGRTREITYGISERKVNSFYGAAGVSYKNYLYLNVTGRNDWFSTLSPTNRSIFYPSATASFVFSDAFTSLPKWLSFGKLRVAYAEVGDDNVAPYSNALYYAVNSNMFPNPSGNLIPVGGITSGTIPNGDLRPLRVSEAEAGLDLKLFNNAIGLDVAVYRKISKDQIVSAQISNTTSYTSQLINVGRSMNKGIEVAVSGSPVKSKSFQWNINANVSYNTSEVLQLGLTPADTMITVGGIRQVVGKPMGQIYTTMYLRDNQGRQMFDRNSGFPLADPILRNVGTNQPEYFGGITNAFNYKGISLSALIDFKLGSNYISGGGANYNYWRHGLHKGTLPGRDVGYVVGNGVTQDGNVNTRQAEVQPYYEATTGLSINEPFLANAGFWKLRQVSLGYDFTKFLPKSLPISGLKLSIVSNNVAVLKKWTDNMDPEEIYGYSDNNSGVRAWSSLPLTRSLGFNLNVKF